MRSTRKRAQKWAPLDHEAQKKSGTCAITLEATAQDLENLDPRKQKMGTRTCLASGLSSGEVVADSALTGSVGFGEYAGCAGVVGAVAGC